MENNIFEIVKKELTGRLLEVLELLLPEGRVIGNEYTCGSFKGEAGSSCKINLNTGMGCDFATGEKCGDIISLVAKVNNLSQFDAAKLLASIFDIDIDKPEANSRKVTHHYTQGLPEEIMTPIPETAPPLPAKWNKGIVREYKNTNGETLFYVIRIDKPHGKKAFFPVCLFRNSQGNLVWRKKAPPKPISLYRLEFIDYTNRTKPILIVEGEKAADSATKIFAEYVCISWMGGANASSNADWSPLANKDVTIWPDNDNAGFKAALNIADILSNNYSNKAKIVPLPDNLPPKWDVADPVPEGINLKKLLSKAMLREEFLHTLSNSTTNSSMQVNVLSDDEVDFNIPEWPTLSKEALYGFAGDFVSLAVSESEADPAAVLITLLTRFSAEIYGFANGKGAYLLIGDTRHAPRIFTIICGNSSKARKGTSSQPVIRLFKRDLCDPAVLSNLNLLPPAKLSGGPLSSGEGLGFQLSDNSPDDSSGDKRLFIMDEELASGLSCTKREGNTLSMAIRTFWDGGTYAPLTKSNQVKVTGAHLCIVSHITQSELTNLFSTVQMTNGFGNRFLWICAKRPKLVALPRPMPTEELGKLQLRLWELVKKAQDTGKVSLTPKSIKRWYEVYPTLTQESQGLFGAITARAEAQTIRLSLIYALLDGKKEIEVQHINSALALWNYASDSARVLFHDRAVDPLEQKILNLLKKGSLTSTELSNAFNRNIPKEKLQGVLIKLEASSQITITKEPTNGRPIIRFTLNENTK